MNYIYIALGSMLFYFLRYWIIAGLYHILVYKIFNKQLLKFKINKNVQSSSDYRREAFWGTLTGVVYAPFLMLIYFLYMHDLTLLYFNINDYGLFYTILSGVLVFIIQDAYFYWAHYSMHKVKFIQKFSRHYIHHQSNNPSVWSAFSVHPCESFMELMFRPLILIVMPLHPYAIAAYLIISFIFNVIGHSGYELLPSGFTRFPILKYFSSPTHHYIHHVKPQYHFSLYFSWWDKIMGTEDPDFHKKFEDIASQNAIKLPVPMKEVIA